MKIAWAAACAVPVLLAQTPVSPTIPDLPEVNPDILKLVVYDQWDRGNDLFGGHRRSPNEKVDIGKRDQERQDAVRKLLADGKLKSGKDYRFASLIFQHSPDTPGYLLAHVLAVTAVSKGDASSKWLAAATMDRYLQSLNQPQVFGTQFRRAEGGWTMEPYDRSALSDAVRADWCVLPVAEQESILKDARRGEPIRGTGIKACK